MSPAEWGQILGGQLADPFRIGLIVALVVTMLRTEAVTGRWVPLAAGVVFVAAILPMTTARSDGGSLAQAIAMGVLANLVILGLVMAARLVVLRVLR